MASVDRLSLPFETEQVSLPDGPVLVLRATGADVFRDFADLRVSQGFKPTVDRLIAQSYPLEDVSNTQTPICVIVQITRDKSENLGLIATAQNRVQIGGLVMVDGTKTDGIDSLYKTMRKLVGDMPCITKSHGRVFWWIKKAEHTLPDWDSSLTPTKQPHGFYAHAGMFSPEKIDNGSELLAKHLEGNLSGKVGDLGAGWGWLAHQALASNPKVTALHLSEAEESALNCAKLNITDERAVFHWTDVTTMSANRSFDAIIMNPPFHQSRRAEPELGRQFIAAAGRLLRPKGRLWMVANRQLAYEDALTANFGSWENLEETTRFKIFRARNPKSAK
jgi:16S rRNA (guanine1207-N2)-methyltransferase